jgi:hypothetical protein
VEHDDDNDDEEGEGLELLITDRSPKSLPWTKTEDEGDGLELPILKRSPKSSPQTILKTENEEDRYELLIPNESSTQP